MDHYKKIIICIIEMVHLTHVYGLDISLTPDKFGLKNKTQTRLLEKLKFLR